MIFLCIGTTVIVSGVHVGLGNYVRSGVIMVVPFPSGLIVRMQEETGGRGDRRFEGKIPTSLLPVRR